MTDFKKAMSLLRRAIQCSTGKSADGHESLMPMSCHSYLYDRFPDEVEELYADIIEAFPDHWNAWMTEWLLLADANKKE